MTNSEHQQLIEFLSRKFTEVDARFDTVDQRFAAMDALLDQTVTKEELREQQAETRRHFEVIAEGLRADIRQVAEDHQVLVAGQARIMAGTLCAASCNGSWKRWSASWES